MKKEMKKTVVIGEKMKAVIITVDDSHMASIQEVAQNLKAAGMNVVDVMATVGIIAGFANDLNSLEEVDGVHAAEWDQEMTIKKK